MTPCMRCRAPKPTQPTRLKLEMTDPKAVHLIEGVLCNDCQLGLVHFLFSSSTERVHPVVA